MFDVAPLTAVMGVVLLLAPARNPCAITPEAPANINASDVASFFMVISSV
jgi:hypothetical protein